jgi:hypothetical protein
MTAPPSAHPVALLVARALLSPEVGQEAFRQVPPEIRRALPEPLRTAFEAVRDDVARHGSADGTRIVKASNGNGKSLSVFFAELLLGDIPEHSKVIQDLRRHASIVCLESIQPRKATDLLTDTIPEPQAIVEKFLHVSTVLMIAGPPKVGKTWLTLQLGLSLVLREILPRFPGPGPEKVLYIGGEGNDSHLKKRLLAAVPYIEEIEDEDLENLFTLSTLGRVKVDDPAGAEAIARCAEGVDVLIFDPIFRFQGRGSENDHADARALHDFFDRFKMDGKTIVLVHHQRKPGPTDAGISEISGAGWDRYVDGALRLQRKREEAGGRFLLKFDLRHDETPDDMSSPAKAPSSSPPTSGSGSSWQATSWRSSAKPAAESKAASSHRGARPENRLQGDILLPEDRHPRAERDGLIFSAKRAGRGTRPGLRAQGNPRMSAQKIGTDYGHPFRPISAHRKCWPKIPNIFKEKDFGHPYYGHFASWPKLSI